MKKDEKGNPIPRHEIANFSAKQLKKYFWTCQTPTGHLSNTQIRENTGAQNTHDLTIEELKHVIGKWKKETKLLAPTSPQWSYTKNWTRKISY